MKGLSPQVTRALVAFCHDVVMAALSFVIALYLRVGDLAFGTLDRFLVAPLVVFTLVCAAVFWFTGLYRGIWRYASLSDMVAIARAVTLALLIYLPITFMVTRLEAVPRSMLVINWFVLAFLLSTPRLLFRVIKDQGFVHLLERRNPSGVPVLLIGAGDAAEAFIREMGRDRTSPYDVLGVVDEKGSRVGRQMRGVRVLGHLKDLSRILDRVSRSRVPQRLILTKPLTGEVMKDLLDLADRRGMTLSRLPKLTEFKSGEGEALTLRPIAIEDLLRRPQTTLDREIMGRLVKGRRVLVTGAGGTIGSELVRQVAALEPASLTLLDSSEYLLYSIDLELSEKAPALIRTPVLANIRDRAALDEVMLQHRPELVFHAAALKHVPMVEANPVEGILTNAIGTRNVADACRRAGVIGMVQISTDKAVNPQSVMGATKRLAEAYCQAQDLAASHETASAAGQPVTRYVTVRFGNVLGSTGSVVPLFQRQLAAGGPLTVTHPDMTRYFMTVREAVELVLEASALALETDHGDQGKIYVLDMGEPVKIVELARQMIRLAGLRPDKDVEITFTGLRPGEKLFEDLFHGQEDLLPTEHDGLHLAAPRTLDLERLQHGFDELETLAQHRQEEALLVELGRLIPEYGEAMGLEQLSPEEPGEPAPPLRPDSAAAAS